MISMDKKYRTKSGRNVTIISMSRKSLSYTVVALVSALSEEGDDDIYTYTSKGEFERGMPEHSLNLVEVSPYDHIKKGDVVLVWNNNHRTKGVAIFDKYENNSIYAYRGTLENNELFDCAIYDNCELYTGENHA